MLTSRLDAWLFAYLLKLCMTRPAAFPGLCDSESHRILDLIGAEAGRCCPYLVLPDIIPASPLKRSEDCFG